MQFKIKSIYPEVINKHKKYLLNKVLYVDNYKHFSYNKNFVVTNLSKEAKPLNFGKIEYITKVGKNRFDVVTTDYVIEIEDVNLEDSFKKLCVKEISSIKSDNVVLYSNKNVIIYEVYLKNRLAVGENISFIDKDKKEIELGKIKYLKNIKDVIYVFTSEYKIVFENTKERGEEYE